MKQIEINGKTYNLKYTVRSLFLFETIAKKPFKLECLLDTYLFYYCMILANNPDNVLEWDEYLDSMDADPQLFKKMSEIIEEQQKKDEIFNSGEEKGKKGSKKK